ncbi:NAD-dependent epimerase/dehydratase family protein [Actinophytocola oryzae]|nr:NAD-dependent epimerase/dehydratase family protein [Actinophytocola oryzae]
MAERVLVTGASGYIAGHVIAELRTHGYEVRGTARRLVDGLEDVVAVDLLRDDGWAEAVEGCDYVLHVASPVPRGVPRSDDEVVRPAVDGTLRVLRAAADAGVRRVVVTSSVNAVTTGLPDDRVHTEADWSDVDRCPPYQKSKTLAERAAWEFAESTGLELVTTQPGTVVGPLLGPAAVSSAGVVLSLLARQFPAVPNIGSAMVDVRDVAVAHRLAMTTPAAAGNRYILAGEHLWLRDMARLLAEVYNPRGFRVPTGAMPTWLLWLVGRFDQTARQGMQFVDRRELVSADKARRELGWTMRPVRESILATAESLIEHGLVGVPAVRGGEAVEGGELLGPAGAV